MATYLYAVHAQVSDGTTIANAAHPQPASPGPRLSTSAPRDEGPS
ncbi:hypothetical protein [Streptomyces sp. H27-C3]